jgi:hypothetical protein
MTVTVSPAIDVDLGELRQAIQTEFLWRKPPTPEARQIFLGEVCPAMNIDTLDDWVQIYREAGLSDVQVTSGPFEMTTPVGFVRDEGIANSLAIMGRALSRRSYLKKMAWLMPRMSRAVPYLDSIAVSELKPAMTQNAIDTETLRRG